MGRPPSIRRRPRPEPDTDTLNRRGFFTRAGAATAILAASPAMGAEPLSGRHQPPRGEEARVAFLHGVASGDPDQHSVLLWTRVTPPARAPATPQVDNEMTSRRGREDKDNLNVIWLVANDPALRKVVAHGRTRTGPGRDYTVKVEAGDLAAGRTFYYRFFAEGVWSPIGRTRTLPAGHTTRLRLAVASCSNHAAGYFNAYRQIARRSDLDAVVHLGDYLYEYGPAVFGSLRVPDPPYEMVTLSDYRRRHAQYKADADLQEVHRQHPMICIWDDHEITNDAWRDGAQNHTEGVEGAWGDRVRAALTAYYEWMPVREREADDQQASRPSRRLQRSFRFGDLAELVMLEERLQARSQQLAATIAVPGLGNGFVQKGAFTDPTRTLLGDEQEAWLGRRLRLTPARWKLVGQQVMFAPLKLVAAPRATGGGVFANPDQWDGYQPARDRIFEVLRGGEGQPAVEDCIVLTGDIHSSWAADLTPDPNNPLPATGGYDAATGTGSLGVEFVTTSITSPGLNDPNGSTAAFLRSVNPHFKYVELNNRGYCLLDITHQKTVCEWWHVDSVVAPSNVETLAVAMEVLAGTQRLVPSAMTSPKANPPALAP
ncbi:MAG: alkaline phosphatase D family protein [Rubrivivax sp.]|nr:alkaline phosphatase D family protein [Rubrivivax sp.]